MIKRTRLSLIALSIILVSGLLIVLLIMTRPTQAPEKRPLTPVRVNIAEIRSEDIQPERWLSGLLQPARKTSLHFELSGRLQQRLVDSGQRVTQGEPLLRIDDGDWRNALQEARARLTQENAAIDRDRQTLRLVAANRALQEKEVDRLRRLREGSLASGSQLEISEQKLLQLRVEEAKLQALVDSADARRMIVESAVERARRNLDRTVLRAPFDGTVNRVEAEIGDHMTPAQAVVEIIDDRQLDLYLEVDRTLAAALRPGQAIDVEIDAQPARTGRIIALQKAPQPRTYSYPLRIRLPASPALPGQPARARLPLKRLPNALVVPAAAILHDEGKRYVFRVEQGRLQRIPVTVGPRVGDRQVIDGRLQAGDPIVRDAVAALSDGQAVVLLERPGEP